MLEDETDGPRTPQTLISPVPSPSSTLSTEINTATRVVHARLNKLITARLPLALPPYSDDSELFGRGINAFAQVFFAFEGRWHDLVAQQTVEELSHPTHEAQVRQWLSGLVPSGLWRAKAIRSDLEHMSRALGIHLDAADTISGPETMLVQHSRKITAEKPHTLIAYAWIMYMAIFSGGRWIRQQLLAAGPRFWHVLDVEQSPFGSLRHPVPGFSLFYFEGERDGEDIKADFKARLEMAEGLLSQQERNEVVEEAQVIFDMCIGLVEGLDEELVTASRLTGTGPAAAHATAEAGHTQPSVLSQSRSRAHSPLTALLAVLLACLIWFAWS